MDTFIVEFYYEFVPGQFVWVLKENSNDFWPLFVCVKLILFRLIRVFSCF